MITISVDEKPGIQVIKNIATDLPQKPGVSATISIDYEYKGNYAVFINGAKSVYLCSYTKTWFIAEFN